MIKLVLEIMYGKGFTNQTYIIIVNIFLQQFFFFCSFSRVSGGANPILRDLSSFIPETYLREKSKLSILEIRFPNTTIVLKQFTLLKTFPRKGPSADVYRGKQLCNCMQSRPVYIKPLYNCFITFA